MSNIKYSIICCYYNEINLLKKKFIPLMNEIKNLPFSFEIFICDNNSNDGSKEFLKEIEAKQTNGIKFVYNEKNLGCTLYFYHLHQIKLMDPNHLYLFL